MIKIENVEVMGWEHVIRGMRNPMNSWEKSDSGICKGGDDGIGCENCANYDSCDHTYDHSWQLGKADHDLMMRLSAGGSTHAKYRRMITVYADITAPLYWWKEFDTYKVGTVANSCSTMHKIAEKAFTVEDFSIEHLMSAAGDNDCPLLQDPNDPYNAFSPQNIFMLTLRMLNACRAKYLETKDKDHWWQMIQLLPSSYNQKRTVMLNYEVLAHIYWDRKNHKLDEWREHPVVFKPKNIESVHQVGSTKSGLSVRWNVEEIKPDHLGFCDWIKKLPYAEIIIGDEGGLKL